ncbi:hypothetical protein, partial [Dolichospermum circinale]|uniref:hypothetical protein n=1 Tax=Dolichospermum circinale TaxID=109265 RepID=UPI00232DCDD0
MISIVGSADEAREQIEKGGIDLIILDILLPRRPGDTPEMAHSLDLLFEIREGVYPSIPSYVIGITSDLDAANDALIEFEEWTWTVLQ